jgi:hypothetical protein
MTLTETRRFEMHLGLKHRLGDDVADSLMEHLPPVSWADVARRTDVEHLRSYMDARFDAVDARFDAVDARFDAVDARFDAVDARFDAVDARFDSIEARLGSTDSRIGGVVAGLWALGAICVTCFAGIFTILVTEL